MQSSKQQHLKYIRYRPLDLCTGNWTCTLGCSAVVLRWDLSVTCFKTKCIRHYFLQKKTKMFPKQIPYGINKKEEKAVIFPLLLLQKIILATNFFGAVHSFNLIVSRPVKNSKGFFLHF